MAAVDPLRPLLGEATLREVREHAEACRGIANTANNRLLAAGLELLLENHDRRRAIVKSKGPSLNFITDDKGHATIERQNMTTEAYTMVIEFLIERLREHITTAPTCACDDCGKARAIITAHALVDGGAPQ